MSEIRSALVLGATGGIGGATAEVLLARGWRVAALHRRPEQAARRDLRLEWLRGDAMNPADVVAAAAGVELIVHGVNPPGYRDWDRLALPMLESSIAAARACGARVLFPGTVYNFGPEVGALVAEDAPQRPRTRKGAIRAAMEARLRAASDEGVRVLVVRAGDFFGPRAGNNWFGQGVVKAGTPLRAVVYPGRRNVGHAWAYLPDLAETMVRLVERADDLGSFEVFHFDGHWFERGVGMAEEIRRAAGDPRLPIRGFPWTAAWIASPFVTLFREMLEMRWLWRAPLRLDNRKLVAFLGHEPHTPAPQAIRATLEGLGCLPVRRA